ncbi:hypothetical protein BTO20_37535 (plasmid) [Mycobacterium dioxanotrophicus]|jgi:hypothetical protein|uniref:Uncharacterized protein n=1 Tax=Mycobacterium dioxanotrophicus TaxID=482462 RepID=A0A1Y0CGB9_9MYCO|nr:hypothetical protein [Mycobacterium dioxanotrophicus]ART74328.1 hypothetical protein BTO20_37535 [Mycobacterium dioxanotrophicus]
MTSEGLYAKYQITAERTDGKPIGPYFILEYATDPHARAALATYAQSCGAENPTLASYLHAELARTAPTTTAYDHHITITDNGVAFSCAAPVGQQCRLICARECEDYHRPDCDRTTKDSGDCGALIYLDPADPADTYIGCTEPHHWRSGPISIGWDGFYETWLWRYPGEDRQLPRFARQR